MSDMCSLVRLDVRRVVTAVRDEIADPFSLQKSVNLLVQKFLARVCLEPSRIPGVCILEELLEGCEHLLP